MKTLFGKIFENLFTKKINSKAEIIDFLKLAINYKVISNDSLPLLESALSLDDLRAKDIMLPRNKIDLLDVNDSLESIVKKISTTGHSRFPVIDGEISNLIGIFHTKDLVKFLGSPDKFHLKDYLRDVCFVPEIKKLDTLMYEMRLKHLHIAIVVDEFTNIVGLITLEMIIEQIIGDIEDEYDLVEGEHVIMELPHNIYRIKGTCKLIEINKKLKVNLNDEIVETMSAYIIKSIGRVPLNNEIIMIDKLRIEIINSDSRKINLLTIKPNLKY